ncbi:MAG: 3'-5' exonuclease [Lachnospiraceae bacterium]|nr:3'-5' exonuclease [Lachnospiraceae bacterium]
MFNTYVCIDLETTGLNPKLDKIIEIGAVKVIDGEIKETFETFVNPGRKLEQRIVELTGIKDEQLTDAPYIEEVFPDLLDFLGDLPLLGHSVLFDYSFLKKAAVDRKLTFEREGVDTLKISRRFLTQLEHRSLDYLCEYYGISHQAHRALADAKATVQLYEKLVAIFYGVEKTLFQPKPLIFKVKRDTPATKAQKERLYRLLAQHNITLDVDIEKLTRSEASRLTDTFPARFGQSSER